MRRMRVGVVGAARTMLDSEVEMRRGQGQPEGRTPNMP